MTAADTRRKSPAGRGRAGGAARGRGGGGGSAGHSAGYSAGYSVEKLLAQLEKGRLDHPYLCLGTESWLTRRAIEAIQARVITDLNREWGKEELLAAETNVSEIVRAATAAPMLGGRQLLVVRAIDRLRKADKETFPPTLPKIPDSTVLVMTAEKLDGRTTFARDLKRHCTVVDCAPLPDEAIPRWIRQQLATRGRDRQTTSAVIERLHALVGNDLGTLAGEIDKLFHYIGQRQALSVEDVDQVVAGGVGASLADLVNAIGERRTAGALGALAMALEAGHHPIEVLAYVGYRVHDLWRAAEIGRRPGVWFRPEVLRQVRHHQPAALRRGAIALFDADRRLKSSGGDPRLILERLVLQLTTASFDRRGNPK